VLDRRGLLSVGINAAPLASLRTGVARYIAGLLSGLAQVEEADLRWCALFAPPAVTRRRERLAEKAIRAARSVARRLPGSYFLAQALRGAALVRETRRGLSLYHETNNVAPPFGGRMVLTIHDLSTVLHADLQDPVRVGHFAPRIPRQARDAARVVTPSEAIAREVIEVLGVPRERVCAIPHGVDPAFRPDGPRARPVPRRYVLYLGALGPRKGLETLLDAFAALPAPIRREHDLVLAGPQDGIDPARLRGATLLGYVPDADLPALLRGAAVFCYPSRYEGFGLPVLEALACGVPTVASDDPALVEVAAGRALHAARGDAPALAAALERALDDEPLRAELSRQGPERASQFNWARTARAHVDVYRAAAG